MLDVVNVDDNTKVVEFENKKRRGNVADKVAFRYSTEKGLTYQELLASVSLMGDSELASARQAEEIKSDTEIIDAVIACISDGVNTKMELAATAAKRAGASKRAVLKVIEKYTGTTPAAHRWTYDVGERGAKIYRILSPDESTTGQEFTRV